MYIGNLRVEDSAYYQTLPILLSSFDCPRIWGSYLLLHVRRTSTIPAPSRGKPMLLAR